MPQEEFADIRLLGEFRNFSVNPSRRPVVKHRQNVGTPSFRNLTMEMPVEVTSGQRLVGQFRRLLRTKSRPSSIEKLLLRFPPVTYLLYNLQCRRGVDTVPARSGGHSVGEAWWSQCRRGVVVTVPARSGGHSAGEEWWSQCQRSVVVSGGHSAGEEPWSRSW